MESYSFVWKNFKDRVFTFSVSKKEKREKEIHDISRYVTKSIGLCYSLRYTWIYVLFYEKYEACKEKYVYNGNLIRSTSVKD